MNPLMPTDDTTAVNEIDHDDLKPSYARGREPHDTHRPLGSWRIAPPAGRTPYLGAESRCVECSVRIRFDGEEWVEA